VQSMTGGFRVECEAVPATTRSGEELRSQARARSGPTAQGEGARSVQATASVFSGLRSSVNPRPVAPLRIPRPRGSCSMATNARQCANKEQPQPSQPSQPSQPLCEKQCWNCPYQQLDPQKRELFCSNCGVLQAPGNVDHFALLSLPRSFDIDPQRIDKAYRSMQMLLHPDKFSQSCRTEQAHSLSHAAQVNVAYSVVKDPLERAQYLLNLFGIPEPTTVDPALLAEVLETREAIEEAGEDVSSNLLSAELLILHRANNNSMQHTQREISAAFRRNDLEAATTHTVRLRFLQTIHDEIMRRLPAT
jgi:molecular chaperone HscB